MIGLGTIINVLAIVIGGFLGILLKKAMPERVQNTILSANGLCVIFIGIAGTIEKMFTVKDGALVSTSSMMMILCFVVGSLVGELIDIEGKLELFGEWLKKTTKSEKDTQFLDGFLTASLTVCIGAMAVVGSIQDGISGDYSLLFAKAVLDFIIVMVMASSMGKGCIFSAIPVGVFQGLITILAGFIKPVMTPQALTNLSLTGSMLIFCVGVNLVFGKKFKVANMLPTIVFAVIWAFLPI